MKSSWKTLAVIAAAIAAVLALSTSALAVGGGSRSPSPEWRTTLGAVTWSGKLTALYPGAAADTELLHFTVTNAGGARQRLSSITVSMPAATGGDAETTRGADIAGCRAAWFTRSVDRGNRPLPVELTPSGSYVGAVDLAMRDSGTNQNACRGASPAVTISAG